jgi:predicted alpha/beta superfamily hydrolase
MKKYFVAVILLILAASGGFAQELVERLTLKSQVLNNEERVVYVRAPPGYQANGERYPVLYLTDAPRQMSHTIATVDFLAREGRMLPLIIVGVETGQHRTRDLTPTNANMPRPEGGVFALPTSGGGAKFLQFMETELIPHIEGKYRTRPWRAFAGHSFGGLFAMYAFVTKPDLFNAYIGVSPTMGWDDNFISKRAEELFKTRKELPRTVFFTMANEGGESLAGFNRFKDLLKKSAPKGLAWEGVLMDDEDHGSTVMRAHYFGFRKAFEGLQPSPEAIAGGLKTIEAHYQKLSARFGYAIQPPEPLINQLGYQLLGNKKLDEAITVFKYNAQQYPNSANVYDSLAEAYENAGKMEEARANYEKAWQMGQKNNDPNLETYKTNFERTDATLKKKAAANN